jgi:hypothetical protein
MIMPPLNLLTAKFKLAISLCVCLLSLIAHADSDQLMIKPNRCIALHEGQVCYQTLKFEWKTQVADTYCLYQQDNKAPLLCWDMHQQARGTLEFESAKTQVFSLQRKRDAKVMAEFTVEVAWVYDASSHRESHWRIF